MTRLQTLTVSGYFKNLAQIGDFVAEAADQAGLDAKAVYAVQMAVDEACTNIIEHAYGGEGNGQIYIACIAQSEGLQISITDQGQPFSPDQIPRLDPTAPLEERNRRGMGMFFIYNLIDRVDYQFDTPQGNTLILFKSRV
ncbi:MAG: ATP-binding protein [Anaerolineae bacterium]|nr:ATP-binding protein [Anaerolineae bacterium]